MLSTCDKRLEVTREIPCSTGSTVQDDSILYSYLKRTLHFAQMCRVVCQRQLLSFLSFLGLYVERKIRRLFTYSTRRQIQMITA